MDGPILVIDRGDGRPVGVQLVEGLRRGILGGALRPGDPVPSTRALASELGVSRSAVVAAYEQLAGEGYLEMRQGAPTRVGELAHGFVPAPVPDPDSPSRHEWSPPTRESPPLVTTRVLHEPAEPRIDLRPGRPSTARIDTRAWRAAWRHAAALGISAESPPDLGVRRLREEIADHLRHARGVACDADDVVVTAGTSEAVALVASALLVLADVRSCRDRERPDADAPGLDRRSDRPDVTLAVEHPGYPSARRTIERRGVHTVPVPVDADGLRVDLLRRMPRPPRAVMVTPSHQYPLGGRLPVSARLALLEWAREHDAIVVEDDYDSEFRHLGPPLPALASLDGGANVVLVGSFSKVLTPWLRLGYLVLPANPGLRDAIAQVRADESSPVAGVVQDAAAALLASGAVRRHIAVTRRDYAHRRRLVLEALDGIPGAPLSGLDGGLHAVVRLPGHAASRTVVARLAAEGIAVEPLGTYSAVPGEEEPGIVFGYAGPGDTQLVEALERIRAAILDAM